MNIPLETLRIIALIATLALGAGYAYLVNRLQRKGRTEGVTSLLVVAGVLLTLIISAPFTRSALDVFYFFAASGTPMIIGDIYAYIKRREKGRELTRDE